MNARGWRLAALTGAVTALLGALTLALGYLVARNALLETIPDPASALAELGRQLLGWSVIAVPALALLGAALGRRTAGELRSLRRSLLRAEDDVPIDAPARAPAEVRGVAHAAERLRKAFAQRVAAAEEQRSALAVLVDTVSDGLLRVDAGGRIAFANPACRRMLELLPSALGQSYTAVVRSTELRTAVQRALAGEDVSGTEITLGERRVLVSAQRVEQEVQGGVVLALADLTTLRRLEGVRRDFVANVSHELKTPLTSIRGYAETLLHEDVPREMQRQFLEVVQKNARRLQQIVDDLLDLSRIESGGWQPEPARIEAGELIRDVWNSCRHLAERRAIRFASPAGPVFVHADGSALRQVLTNLFDNALRYTPPGGLVEVAIARLDAPLDEDGAEAWVAIEVRDTGSGIPRDALPRIFERFYRVDPARSRAEGGTGLGLAIVKHLVESMGGEVSARSELGKGTTIRFTLPAA